MALERAGICGLKHVFMPICALEAFESVFSMTLAQPSALDLQALLALAHSRDPGERERLLVGIADLCDGPGRDSPGVRLIVHDIFMTLVLQAERDLRGRLAERIAPADWAPPELIKLLAMDEIEIARPVIAKSPLLADADLIRLLIETTIEHQIEVARRPHISEDVVGAIIDAGQPAVLASLAANDTAEVSGIQMARLVAASRRIAAMRAPLTRHPKLTPLLAHSLYAWVGETLKEALARKFEIDPAALEAGMAETVREVMSGDPGEGTVVFEKEGERDEMERRLISKLQAADQLRPGYLLRCLREGRLSLFVKALAALGGYTEVEAVRAINAEKPDLLALACAGVGFDRSVFPAVLDLVRTLNHGKPAASLDAAGAAALFALSPSSAAGAFRLRIKA
jgi:uncharacterized protein (DUF2336 family)